MSDGRIVSMAEMFDAQAQGNRMIGRGANFFVDGAFGNDSNRGTTWGTALKTLTAALGKCTGWYDDCIFVNNYGNQATESYPIDWNKEQVHVFGVSSIAYPQLVQSDSGDTPAILFPDNDGTGSSFYNMAFATGTTPTIAATKATGDIWNLWFDHCWWGWMGQPAAYGWYSEGDTPDLWFTNCHFDAAEGIVTACILCLGSSTRMRVWDSEFRIGTGNMGITDTGGTGGMGWQIYNNKFKVFDAAAGEAIYLTGAGHCMVDGNSAFEGSAAMTFNPYRDTGTNSWGLNYRQGVSILPVTV